MEFKDPKAGEPPLAELSGIQFGILSKEEILKVSVFEDNFAINKAKELWDNRLGVYNLAGNDKHCGTCGATNASECDGHFGHVNLPLAIYHPLHIRYLRNLLSRICLVCHRFKGQEFKKGSFEDEATWMEIQRQIEDRESLNESDCEIEVLKHRAFSIKTSSMQEFTFKSKWTHASGKPHRISQSIKTTSTEMRSNHIAACIGTKGCALPSPIDISDDDSPRCAATQKTSDKPEHLHPVKISKNFKCAEELGDELESSASSDDEEGCKYCGAKLKKRDERYPNLIVSLSKMKDNSYETIEMKAVGKEEKIPLDYWSFVQGHAGGCKNIRPLLPFEAFNILKSLSKKVIRKLGMDERLARPESLIMYTLPLPPSGSRITEMDFGSSLPRAHTDGQHIHLRRLASEIKKIRSSLTGKLNFAGYKNDVMELQSIASDYLTGSKWENGVKPKTFNVVKNDVEKEDKLMKGHILAKMNNASARMVVVGDPSIKLEELLLPLFLVEHLTIPENVTALNINRLQQSVDNGPHANLLRTGAVCLDRPGRGRVRLSAGTGLRRITLEVGDTVHRHLRNGDLVIVNRPPSLSKHSIMAMQVRLHLGCSLSINPLICASFQADFDGDCMHLFVPQSSEALAEVHGLMSVSDQLINPQGGQSNNALAEDSRLGAYLISSSCLFLDKTEMSQLASSSLLSLPIPAILKSPKRNEPLWTGQQLYSTVLPKGIFYRATDKKFSTDVLQGIFIQDGELLVCEGSSIWLGNAPDALTAVISKSQGPAAALAYLNRAQDLANMFLRDRGFSVGLHDFQLTRNRSHLLKRRLEEVARANREALMQSLLADEHVQREELKKNPTSKRGLSVGTECHKSKGLYLGTTGIVKRVEALDKVAIERFQSKFGLTASRLAKDYCKIVNPLLVMIKAGSKGSMSKLNQQVISLGLQLYKGEHLIPWRVQDFCQKQVTDVSSLKAVDLLQFENRSPLVYLPGYWESRGIITSSYVDGLSLLQFFTHTIASRYGLMRAKVEQPNLLLRRLLLFLRDLHVGYDGSVRSLQGQQIVQYEYGGLLEMDEKGFASRPKKNVADWCEAGEAVGILAATALTEPLYQLKLDSPNMIGAKAMGPLELINETLSSSKVLKLIDRRVLLRMPFALRNRRHGQEKGATRIQQYLKPVTLDMVASTTMIEYRKAQIEVEEGGRKSPWVGHIQLDVEKLKAHQASAGEIVKSLENKYSKCTFSSSNRCHFGCHFGSSSASQEEQEPCIHFFMDVPVWVATLDDNEYEIFSSSLLEAMKGTILPILLSTTIKGDERIESFNILWEEMNWNPRCAKNAFSRHSHKHGIGELVVEVTVKEKYCKVRGKAWEIVTMACLPILQLLDWQRCMPYSIKEVNHVFGLEAAKGVMLQRLELAVEGMGKHLNQEHLELITDSMLTSGEVNGASMLGYKDLCKALSRSTPFSNAAYQDPKNSFIHAGRQGAYETIDGALSSSVWGKTASLGTGSNFGIFWQPAKTVEEPLRVIQKGVDIHQCIVKCNSLLPPEPCKLIPIRNSLTKPGSKTAAEAFRYRTHRRIDSFPYIRDDAGRRFTGNSDDRRPHHLSRHVESSSPPSEIPSQQGTAGAKGILGDGRNIKPSRPKMAEANGVVGDRRNVKPSQPTMAGAKGILGDGRSKKNSDSNKGIKHSHRGHQRSTRRFEREARLAQDSRGRGNATKVRVEGNPGEGVSSICMDQGSGHGLTGKREQVRERRKLRRMRPLSDDSDQVANDFERENHAFDPVTLPDSVGEAAGSPGAVGREDSSSFHTPNETLDQSLSANSSPSSNFRRGLDPPPLSLDFLASEGDQMSGIGQPPLQTPIDKVVRAESCAIRQPSSRVDPLELPDALGSGSVSPIAQTSRDQGSRHQLTCTIRTERLKASEDGAEDALERRKEEQKDEWEKLLQLSRTVKYILHRKYEASEKLQYKDQKLIMEKLLSYHPDYLLKVGCGVKCIKVDQHENHANSRCFFVVRLDGTVCDFSFRKCIKGYANAKSPALAMQYDHEVLLKHERENCSDADLPYSPDLYPDSPNVHEQLASDLIPPAEPNEGECNGLKLRDSKHKEESWCETSELKPGLQGSQVIN